MKKVVKVGLIVLAIIVDIMVYILLAVALMNYDDLYNGPQEKYGDWDAMAPFDKYIFIAWIGWNIVNLFGIAGFVYFVIKKMRRRKQVRKSDF